MVGGYLLGLGFSLATVFAIAAVPALLAGLAIFAKGRLQALPELAPVVAAVPEQAA